MNMPSESRGAFTIWRILLLTRETKPIKHLLDTILVSIAACMLIACLQVGIACE